MKKGEKGTVPLERVLAACPWIDAGDAKAVAARYPVRITAYYFALIRPGDPGDPIARQCMPDPRELDDHGESRDPFGERNACVPGFVQRYADRALVMATTACAVRCRHCTRKGLLGAAGRVDHAAALAAVRARPGIREVLVSGGDPLLLPPDRLDRLLGALRAIPHVEVLRVGTRLPVVDPDRVDDDLADRLARHRPLWINTQFNHPRELTPAAGAACERLIRRGIPVSNQAVLLRGVNDDVDVLVALCNGLQARMIRPYYLFHGDPVAGTAHLRTELAVSQAMARALARRLSGLACPRVVADVPGAAWKVPVDDAAALAERAQDAARGGHPDGAATGAGTRGGV